MSVCLLTNLEINAGYTHWLSKTVVSNAGGPRAIPCVVILYSALASAVLNRRSGERCDVADNGRAGWEVEES